MEEDLRAGGDLVNPEAIVAAHREICEDSMEECMEWPGRCVKAVEAAAPYLIREARAAELEAAADDAESADLGPIDRDSGGHADWLRERAAAIRAEQ